MEERQVALPTLYGAPAYRPPRHVVESEKPFDPDELPITASLSDEERELVDSLPPEAFAGGGLPLGVEAGREAVEPEREPRRGLRGFTRLLGRD